MAHISRVLRQQVAERACFRCEYCQSPERITSGPMPIEHIIPTAAGGSIRLDNLAYACARCNLHKAKRTHFLDPVSNRRVALFNPRIQRWSRHFAWSLDGVLITGRTRAGRATIIALNMNHPTVVMSRSFWVRLDVHPPDVA
ncbi:MAG: HNH endonuclease [Chloroflexi bacterium]|nr:MAG: HNH endonuclease [Chloroflexota bacterium]